MIVAGRYGAQTHDEDEDEEACSAVSVVEAVASMARRVRIARMTFILYERDICVLQANSWLE